MTKFNYKISNYSLKDFSRLFKSEPGVYLWTNLYNGKNYVGSSNNIKRRVGEYLNPARLRIELRRGESKIYRSILKNGYSSFSLTILEYVDTDIFDNNEYILLEIEQNYINKIKPEYNILTLAKSNQGHIISDERRAKISKAKKGKSSHRKGRQHNENSRMLIKLNSAKRRTVYIYSVKLELLNTYNSIKNCANFTNISRDRISRAIKSNKLVDNKYYFYFKPLIT